MTESPPTGRTKRALRALAADCDRDQQRPRDVVQEATDALSHVERATRFLAADGVSRLARAVVQSIRAGDDEAVQQGREALATLRSLRSALATDDVVDSVDWSPTRRRSASDQWLASVDDPTPIDEHHRITFTPLAERF